MEQINLSPSKQAELIAVANLMLAGELELIEGVRQICSLRFSIGDPDNEVFLPIRAIDSETDHFPVGDMRSRCSAGYLRRMDAEMTDYLGEAKLDILEACKGILRTYSR